MAPSHPHPNLSSVLKDASSEPREFKLTGTTGAECQTLQLGSSWTSASLVECYLVCTKRFPDACQSVVYNSGTRSCTPGSTAFGPIENLGAAIPSHNSNDAIYYRSQPVPTCNTGLGFSLYTVCGTSACLSLSTSGLSYYDAVDECTQLTSSLFSAESEARFSLFWYVSLNKLNRNTWLGLSDRIQEGKYIWENGNPLSTWQDRYIWRQPAEPNGGGYENCIEAKHWTWPGVFGLNDVECWYHNYFICEQ